MVLNKRYKRNIKDSLSLYVSSTILTMLSLLLFYLYYICGTGILDYTTDFFETQKIEDANFSTYMEIPDEKIAEYENKYDLELEKQRYINIETDGVTARVFEKTEKIDIYKVTEGKDVAKDNEVVISEGYAQNMGIAIGDSIKIKNKEYIVSGFIERPDYLYMLQNLTDSYKNITSFFLCYMTENEFESLGDKNCQYLVRYEKDNSKDFRQDINDNYIMSSYVASNDNYRINMTESQPELFILMAYCVLFTMPLIVVILISLILSRKIRSEQKMIGTLAANGYSSTKIILHYAGFSAIPGVIGGLLTTLGVYLFADSYGALGLMDYEPMDVDFSLNVPQMLLGIIVPTVMYILSTVVTVKKLLKNDITVLLAGNAKGKERIKKFLVNKDVSFRTKFNVRSMVGNFGRTFVLFLGVFLGSLVIFFALADNDSLLNISDATTANMEKYSYQYLLNELNDKNDYGGETILAASVEDEHGSTVSIYGADNNSLIGLKDLEGNPLKPDDRYFISSLYATFAGVEVGDTIEVINPLSLESYKIKISEIVDNNFGKVIYTSRANVSKMSGIDKNLYNMILSPDKLDVPEDKTVTVISKSSIEDQYKAVMDQMNVLIYLLAGIGVLLCIIGVYIAVNMVITENRSNISMLRVLGYDDKHINRLLLNDNIFIVIFAIAVSIPAAIYIGNAMFKSFIDILGYMIDVYIKPSTYVISIILVLASYYVSKFLVSRKIAKVDMVESLKDNRE